MRLGASVALTLMASLTFVDFLTGRYASAVLNPDGNIGQPEYEKLQAFYQKHLPPNRPLQELLRQANLLSEETEAELRKAQRVQLRLEAYVQNLMKKAKHGEK